MKLLKIEKIWLIVGIGVWLLYNLPGVPAQGKPGAAVVWNVVFFAAIWIVNYVFNGIIRKIYAPKKTDEEIAAEFEEMGEV